MLSTSSPAWSSARTRAVARPGALSTAAPSRRPSALTDTRPLTSPQDVVAEMTRLTRPGGIVALQEPDSAAWAIDPPHPAGELLLAEVTDVYPRTGRDFRTFLLTRAVLMRQDILAAGRLTPGQLDGCTAELREHLSQPGTLTCLPTIWQAWAANPGPTSSGK